MIDFYNIGHLTNSLRVEGIHSLIKSHIKRSTFDLFDAWQAIKHAVVNQLKELRQLRASQQLRAPLDISGVTFEAVRGRVSYQALRKVQEQRQLLSKPFKGRCSQSFTSSYGLPCAHALKELEDEKQSLLLKHFHPHWYLQRHAPETQPLLEPRRARNVFQELTQPPTSTRREPSGFERVEVIPKAPSRCSKCHNLGHHRRSKECPLRYSELLPTMASLMASQSTEILAAAPTVTPTVVPTAAPTAAPKAAPTTALLKTPSIVSLSVAVPQRYNSPEAIYTRYISAREAWYSQQPAGSIKTNQQYRRAMKLPQRYPKSSYEWCQDYKIMGRNCRTRGTTRPWTKEEMMAYLDWSTAEEARIEENVQRRIETNGLWTASRGLGYLWAQVDQDIEDQDHLHRAS